MTGFVIGILVGVVVTVVAGVLLYVRNIDFAFDIDLNSCGKM